MKIKEALERSGAFCDTLVKIQISAGERAGSTGNGAEAGRTYGQGVVMIKNRLI